MSDHSLPAIPGGASAPVYLSGVEAGCPAQTIEDAVRAVAEAITDFRWLSKGDTVFIKPALNSGRPYPSTTSPLAIAAMVKLLRDKGAGRVLVGDMSGVENVKLFPDNSLHSSSRLMMTNSGMAQAAVSAGAELYFFEEAGWDAFHAEEPLVRDAWRGPLYFPNILNDVQHIVLMPRCGRHALTGSTLGLKAIVGYWRYDTRLEYHHDAYTLHEKLAEGYTVPVLRNKQRLTLTAADKVLVTYGPDQGETIQPSTGLIIGSESMVTHDMVSLAWLMHWVAQVPSSHKTFFKDPYSHPVGVMIGNKIVVHKLGGIGQAFSSQWLELVTTRSIWDDRILNHAFHLLGEFPQVRMETVHGRIPEQLLQMLRAETALPLRRPA